MSRLDPALPSTAERRYVADLRRVWRVCQQTIMLGLEPLISVWDGSDDPGSRNDQQESIYPAGERGFPREYRGIFAPVPLARRIWELSDQALLRLWPELSPADVREYAPWATSRDAVVRLASAGGAAAAQFDPQRAVRAAIAAERRARANRPPLARVRIVDPTSPGPRRPRVRYLPTALRPVIFGLNGNVLTPPQPKAVNASAITRQIRWIDMVLQDTLGSERLAPVIDGAGVSAERVVDRELRRLIPIDVRRTPGARDAINVWRERNIDLIESGLRATMASPRLRPSLLDDVSRVLERANSAGLRVEYFAGELEERFSVSLSRAELIARDQTLKLNGQLHRSKQLGLGISEYIWRTSGDRSVRERHAELNDTRQSWGDPPEVGRGRHEHPGGDYQCRCRARPVLPS